MAITASEARRRLFELMRQVNDDAEAVEIVSRSGTAYLVPEQEYRSLRELAHLMSSPANAIRLLEGIGQARDGLGEPRELVDVPDSAVS